MKDRLLRGPPRELRLPHLVMERELRRKSHADKRARGVDHVELEPLHTKVEIPASLELCTPSSSRLSPGLSICSFSVQSTPLVQSTPSPGQSTLSYFPFTPPPPSNIPSPAIAGRDSSPLFNELAPDGDPRPFLTRISIDINTGSENIGELGKRRGFKGAPLFTQATAKKLDPLSGNSNSPTTPVSPRPPTPRSPLATVTNLIRGSTLKQANKAQVRATKSLEVPQAQDSQSACCYDKTDPFAMTREESFFLPDVLEAVVLTANVDNFGVYHGIKRKAGRKKRKTRRRAARTKSLMQTTIYDFVVFNTTDDTKANGKRRKSTTKSRASQPVIREVTSPTSPDIVLTPASPIHADKPGSESTSRSSAGPPHPDKAIFPETVPCSPSHLVGPSVAPVDDESDDESGKPTTRHDVDNRSQDLDHLSPPDQVFCRANNDVDLPSRGVPLSISIANADSSDFYTPELQVIDSSSEHRKSKALDDLLTLLDELELGGQGKEALALEREGGACSDGHGAYAI